MSVRVTVHQLRDQLPELLERAVQSGQECIIQRDGEDYAVIVSAGQWLQRKERDERAAPTATTADEEEARSREVGQRLDTLGPEYRLPPERQARIEELLARRETTSLTPAERLELEALVAQCDEIMLRRAQALPRVV
jgi:antitoxin (DNA-binding transcriptional repressor) of toxin-antitoxin stability system